MGAFYIDAGNTIRTLQGRDSGLKRGSMPLAYFGGGSIELVPNGPGPRTVSFHEVYERQEWVHNCVNILVQEAARFPIKVYKRNPDGSRERVTNPRHGLVQLLTNPWPGGSQLDLVASLMRSLLVQGNSVHAKERQSAGAPPRYLMPKDWRELAPLDESYTRVEAWQHNDAVYAADSVLHTRWSSFGPYGRSPLTALAWTIKAEDAAQRWQEATHRNSARPSIAVVMDPKARKDAAARAGLRDELTNVYGGVDNAGRPAILGGGVTDIKQLAHTPVEAALIESRRINREAILALYRVPQAIGGILDHATYSNMDAQMRTFVSLVLAPWLELISQSLQTQLIDPETAWRNHYVEFDTYAALNGDPEAEMRTLIAGVQSGIMTLNEARALRNHNGYDNPLADEPLVPVNNLAPLGTQPANTGPTPGSGDPGADPNAVPADTTDAGTLKRHLARAEDRAVRGANGKTWDRDRFLRETAADLPHGLKTAQLDRIADALTLALSDDSLDADAIRAAFEQVRNDLT